MGLRKMDLKSKNLEVQKRHNPCVHYVYPLTIAYLAVLDMFINERDI